MAISVELVNTLAALQRCVDDVSRGNPIAADFEGVALCRTGRLSVVQLYRETSSTIWVVHVTVLGHAAFTTKGTQSTATLKDVLESTRIQKLIYDCRNDADALWNLFHISMANVLDLQILEIAWRRGNQGVTVKFRSGLAKVLQDRIPSLPHRWFVVKDNGTRLFKPELGGSYEVFETNPLPKAILEYCASDVAMLFSLRDVLPIPASWVARVKKGTSDQLAWSKEKNYNGRSGPGRQEAPFF